MNKEIEYLLTKYFESKGYSIRAISFPETEETEFLDFRKTLLVRATKNEKQKKSLDKQ